MNKTQIDCFLHAAELLSFTAAAEKVYITQPALSRNIAALEDELELLLFVRRNNVLRLTPGGEIVYKWLRSAGDAFSAMLDSARRANSEEKNAIHLGLIRNEPISVHLSEALIRFRAQHPDAVIDIRHCESARDMIRNLTEHRTDIAMMFGTAAYGNPRLQYFEMHRYRRCLAVSRLHPAAGRETASLRDFAGETFLTLSPAASPTMSRTIRDVCAAAGFSPLLRETESVTEMISCAEANRGVALLVDQHLAQHNPLLHFIHLEEEVTTGLICVWDRLNTNHNIRAFLSALSYTE